MDIHGGSFNNASTIKTKTGENHIQIEDMDANGSTGKDLIAFDLTRQYDDKNNKTSSTRNSKSGKHVSFKQGLEDTPENRTLDQSYGKD